MGFNPKLIGLFFCVMAYSLIHDNLTVFYNSAGY